MRAPMARSNSIPKISASPPSSTETVTCPKPHSAVMRIARPRDHPCARASAVSGTQ